MPRHRLRDATWASLHAKLVAIPGIWKADTVALRRFVEAVAHVPRTGAAWEDLPAEFGEPGTAPTGASGGGPPARASGTSCPSRASRPTPSGP